MIFHPAVIALLLGSALVTLMILYSATHGIRILQRWDLRSGSELQLELERKTYLLSTIMSYAFGFQLISFFLFIFTEDDLHALFVGAMCAAGTLNANVYGYPAILLKVVNFLLAGTWLIMNYTDNRAYDYPLVRKKYFLLAMIAPLVIAESVLLGAHFFSLKTNIITSCCGSLFSPEEGGIASEIASLPSMPMKIIFYLSMGITLLSGALFYLRGRKGLFFSVMSTLTFFVSAASLISFISLYFYELPTHHCPFCILQKEYGYVGYLLYIALLGGAVSGLGVGAITPFRNIQSLAGIIPAIQKKLALTALLCYLLFALIVTYRMLFSDFILEGY
jgi:hypothetical protein